MLSYLVYSGIYSDLNTGIREPLDICVTILKQMQIDYGLLVAQNSNSRISYHVIHFFTIIIQKESIASGMPPVSPLVFIALVKS